MSADRSAEVRSDQPAPSYEKGADWTDGPIEPPATPSLREALERVVGSSPVTLTPGRTDTFADLLSIVYRPARAAEIERALPDDFSPFWDEVQSIGGSTLATFNRHRFAEAIGAALASSDPGSPSDGGLDLSHAFASCDMCGAAVDDPEAREPCLGPSGFHVDLGRSSGSPSESEG